MPQLLFCMAPKRPKYCTKESNVCCSYCDLNAKCTDAHRDSKLKPCKATENEINDPCEFAV